MASNPDGEDLVAFLQQLSAEWKPTPPEQLVRDRMAGYLDKIVRVARDEGLYECPLVLFTDYSDYFPGMETILVNMLESKGLRFVKTAKEQGCFRWTVSWARVSVSNV